jgi:hypothetical protein
MNNLRNHVGIFKTAGGRAWACVTQARTRPATNFWYVFVRMNTKYNRLSTEATENKALASPGQALGAVSKIPASANGIVMEI